MNKMILLIFTESFRGHLKLIPVRNDDFSDFPHAAAQMLFGI